MYARPLNINFQLLINLQAKTKSVQQRKETFKRAEQYVKEYRQEVRIQHRLSLLGVILACRWSMADAHSFRDRQHWSTAAEA
jgi:hypothetical protein